MHQHLELKTIPTYYLPRVKSKVAAIAVIDCT